MPGRARQRGTAKNKSNRRGKERKKEAKARDRVHLVRTSNYQGPRAEQNSYRELSSNYREPSSSYREPSSSYREPSSNYRESGSSYRESSSNYRESGSSYREPSSNYRESGSSYRESSSNYREPDLRNRELGAEQVASLLQQYLQPNVEREKELQERKKEIMESKARRELNRRTVKETAATRVSYVKKPFARRSRISFILTAAALSLGGVGIYQAVVTQGNASLTYGAMGLCSIFLSAIAILYGGFSFLEQDKNYILAKFGIGISVIMLAGWAVVIIIGLGD